MVTVGSSRLFRPCSITRMDSSGFASARRPAATHAAVPPAILSALNSIQVKAEAVVGKGQIYVPPAKMTSYSISVGGVAIVYSFS